MAQFLRGNDLKVLRFIASHPQVQARQLALLFADSCDITHVVAGLRDRGLIRQNCNRRWSAHTFTVSKDGKRQLNRASNNTQHIVA
jgi:hypothetical protein